MVSQLLQPPGDVLICSMLGNVVHEQRADSASVVGRGDRPVSLLAGYVGLAGDGVTTAEYGKWERYLTKVQ
jgi:hypothetical protein